MKGPLDVHLALVEAGVPHEMSHLAHAVHTAQELPEALQVPAAACVVVSLFRTADGPLALGHPAHSGTHAPRGATPLEPDEVNALTDFSAGLLPPVCLPATVTLMLDGSFAPHDIVYTATGDGGTALKIRYRDLVRVSGASPLLLDLRDLKRPERRTRTRT